MAASGPGAEALWAKSRKPQPTSTATTKPTTESATIHTCLALKAALISSSTPESAEAASHACAKAIAATGLTSNDFWATFGDASLASR